MSLLLSWSCLLSLYPFLVVARQARLLTGETSRARAEVQCGCGRPDGPADRGPRRFTCRGSSDSCQDCRKGCPRGQQGDFPKRVGAWIMVE